MYKKWTYKKKNWSVIGYIWSMGIWGDQNVASYTHYTGICMYCIVYRVECGHFFYRTEQVKQPKPVSHDFRSPIPKFRRTRVKVFIFKKFQGAQISIFFDENWYEAFSYNKEQTQKYEFEIWVSKLFYFHPRKSAFLVFEEKHNFFFFFRVSALIQL